MVSGYERNAKLGAYQSVSAHGGVASDDPHRLVLMLMDGALDRMALARGFLERGEIARKSQVLHSCITIITELRGSLNLAQGGALAHNLSDLYERKGDPLEFTEDEGVLKSPLVRAPDRKTWIPDEPTPAAWPIRS